MKTNQPTNLKQAHTPAAKEQKLAKTRVLFWTLIALLVAATLLLNAIFGLLGARHQLGFDLTANAAYRLGDETKSMLAGLEDEVDIYVLANESSFEGNPYVTQTLHIMQQYALHSARVELTFVDYASDPTFAAGYPGIEMETGNILVVNGEKIKKLSLSELFNMEQSTDGSKVISSSRAEEALTSAILSVTGAKTVRVALLSGNGAADIPAFSSLLTENGYEVKPVNLTTEALDASYGLALLLSPQTDYTKNELDKLDAFLYNAGAYGKTLLYTADVGQEPLPNLEALLREWGVSVGDGAVFETDAERTFQYQPFFPIADYTDETYKNMLIDPSTHFLLPRSRPLEALFEFKDNNYTTPLLQFGKSAGVRPSNADDSFEGSKAEKWGPMPALVLASKRILENGLTVGESHIIVSASTAALEESQITSSSLTNGEYMLNLLKTVLQREDAVNITPKSISGQALAITSGTASRLGVLLAGVLPLGLLVLGVVIWLKRRYK